MREEYKERANEILDKLYQLVDITLKDKETDGEEYYAFGYP